MTDLLVCVIIKVIVILAQLLEIENKIDTVRFVIADDDQICQCLIHFMLKAQYLNFTFAENGEEAISAIDANLEKPTILLLDLHMPFVDRYEVMKTLSSNPDKYGNVKTICISAMPLENLQKNGSLVLFDYYLEKPVDRALLIEKVRLCLLGN